MRGGGERLLSESNIFQVIINETLRVTGFRVLQSNSCESVRQSPSNRKLRTTDNRKPLRSLMILLIFMLDR